MKLLIMKLKPPEDGFKLLSSWVSHRSVHYGGTRQEWVTESLWIKLIRSKSQIRSVKVFSVFLRDAVAEQKCWQLCWYSRKSAYYCIIAREISLIDKRDIWHYSTMIREANVSEFKVGWQNIWFIINNYFNLVKTNKDPCCLPFSLYIFRYVSLHTSPFWSGNILAL